MTQQLTMSAIVARHIRQRPPSPAFTPLPSVKNRKAPAYRPPAAIVRVELAGEAWALNVYGAGAIRVGPKDGQWLVENLGASSKRLVDTAEAATAMAWRIARLLAAGT
jgi:hypothetical protein